MFRPLIRDNFVTIANKITARMSLDTEIDQWVRKGRNSIRCKERNATIRFQTRLALRLGSSNECEQVCPSINGASAGASAPAAWMTTAFFRHAAALWFSTTGASTSASPRQSAVAEALVSSAAGSARKPWQ
jgi:hypothetical protein